jgi:outer membrane protein
MKNINLIFNVLLTMAVVVLFALHFSGKSGGGKSAADNVAEASSNLRIAYFNSDTVRENYELFKVEKIAIEAEMKNAEDRLVGEQKKFQKDVQEFQQRAEFLTITERESREQKLGRRQQELMQLEQQLTDDLQSKEAGVNKRIFDNVEAFLKDYAKKNNFSYVISYIPGGQIWYTNPALDISKDMLDALNADYAKNKTAGK